MLLIVCCGCGLLEGEATREERREAEALEYLEERYASWKIFLIKVGDSMISKEYFGEGKNVEFKREIPKNHEKFLKDIIAFSNSTGGKVILGVEDETCTVFGIGDQSPFKLSDSISNMVFDACTPQIDSDISIKTIEDKTVLEIDVAPGKFRPYYLKSQGKKTSAYIRINVQADQQMQEN